MKHIQRWVLIVLTIGMAVILAILATGAYAQSGKAAIQVKKGQWTIFVIQDTTLKPILYDTSWSLSPDTVQYPYPVYVYDTIRIHDTSYAQFNIYDTIRITDTINNCVTLVPPTPTLVSIFTTQAFPTSSQTDGQSITLGVKFSVSTTAYTKAVRFYKTGTANGGVHKGYLYSSTGQILDSGTFINETATGWQTLQLTKDVQLTAGVTYVAAYYSPTGQYSDVNGGFNSAISNGIITGLASGTDGVNGVYNYGNKFPTLTYQNSNYWVDAVISATQ